MTAITAFGERARNSAAYYAPGTLPLLVVSDDGALAALRLAVSMREAGERFECAMLLDEPVTAHARIFGPELLRHSQDFDQRRNSFELLDRGQLQLRKKPQAELGALPVHILKTLADVVALSDGLVVQTWRECRRVRALLGVRTSARRALVVDASIPNAVADPNADAVVVWAPHEAPASLAPLLFALEEVRRPTYIVAAPSATYGLKTSLVTAEDSARILARARVVIDPSTDGPAAALAFMERGYTVAGTVPAAACEYVPGARAYDPRSRRSAFGAVIAALGDPPPVFAFSLPSAAVIPPPATVKERAPLVSLIVRTRNRTALLRRALQSVEDQTYPATEAVVIDDAGDEPVDALCAEYSRARLKRIERAGVAGAATAGIEFARGKYAGLLDDDDKLFPDHVERVASALERSGALAAYADAMNIYLRPVRADFAVTGYRVIQVPAIDRTSMLSICQVVGSSRVMFDREWVRQSGPFRPECAPADDYEVWLRLVQASDIVRVNAVTSLYSQFSDRSNVSVGSGGRYANAHRLIYALNPTDRPALSARRAAIVRELERLGGHGMAPPVVTLDPQPLLFGG